MKKLPLILSTCAMMLACGSTPQPQPVIPLIDILEPQGQVQQRQYHPSVNGVQMDLTDNWYDMSAEHLRFGSDLVFWNGKYDLVILVSVGDDAVDVDSFRDINIASEIVDKLKKEDKSVIVDSMRLIDIASGDPAIEIKYVMLMEEPDVGSISVHQLIVGKNNLAYNIVCIGAAYDTERSDVRLRQMKIESECDAVLKTLKINY